MILVILIELLCCYSFTQSEVFFHINASRWKERVVRETTSRINFISITMSSNTKVNISQVNNAGIGGNAIDEKGFLAQISKNDGVSLIEYYMNIYFQFIRY